MQGGYQLLDFSTLFPVVEYDDSVIVLEEDISKGDSRYDLLLSIINVDKPLIVHNIKFTDGINFDTVNNIILTKTTREEPYGKYVTQSAIIKNADLHEGFYMSLVSSKFKVYPDDDTIAIRIYKSWTEI